MDHGAQLPRTLKILFSYSGGLPVRAYGGGHQIVRGFARTLAQLGHEVHVVLGEVDEIGAGREDGTVTYHAMKSTGSKSLFASARGTIALLRVLRPDVVCCFTPELGLVAPFCMLSGNPVLTYLADPELLRHDLSITGARNVRRHWGQLLQRLGCGACARVTTISEHTSQQARAVWQIPSERVVTVGTGLHEAYLSSPDEPLARAPGAPLRLLSVGRIALDQKPLDLVARALAQSEVPWSHWTIVGDGTDRHRLNELCSQLGIASRVRHVEFLAPQQIVPELARHDAVILPSRHESFFMTPYEAIVRQRMVVTNEVAEVKSKLGHSPLCVLARDASIAAYDDALGTAWRRLEASPPRDEATAAMIRREYSWQHITARLLAVMLDVAAR